MCSPANHVHTRKPYLFDEEAWLDQKNIDRYEAAETLRHQPTPTWAARIKYNQDLHWYWENCEMVEDALTCGTYEVCDERTVITDTGEQKKVEECHHRAKKCYADVVVHESQHCSYGHMDFDVEFRKKDATDWNPKNENYIDRLANGYDLLPGEEEAVTVSNLMSGWLSSQATQLTPTLSIEDPKNEYKSDYVVLNHQPGSLSCRFQGYDKVSFLVDTEKRIASRSPNGFSLPIDFDNEPIEPLEWSSARGKTGHMELKAFPYIMKVQDFSSAAISEVSGEVSKKLKNIVVRIQLYEPSVFGQRLRSTIYIDEAEGVQQTLNALSEDQKIRRSTLWKLILNKGENPSKNMYRNYIPALVYYPGKILFLPDETLSYDEHLDPDTEYTLKLTVYQKNMPFYRQSCESDPDAWDCKWYALWGLLSPNRYENNYFSKNSLDVTFTSNPDVDLRTWLSTFWHAIYYGQYPVYAGVIYFTFKAISPLLI